MKYRNGFRGADKGHGLENSLYFRYVRRANVWIEVWLNFVIVEIKVASIQLFMFLQFLSSDSVSENQIKS